MQHLYRFDCALFFLGKFLIPHADRELTWA
jgi:hypothetical protein